MILIQSFVEKNWIIAQNIAGTIIAVKIRHRWFSGGIFACHAINPGSIPGWYIAEKISQERTVLSFCNLLMFYCQKRGKLLK